MLTATLLFALLSATLELILLLKFAPQRLLHKTWFVNTVHLTVAVLNLVIHFGTLVGTMTAITATLVSFVTVSLHQEKSLRLCVPRFLPMMSVRNRLRDCLK